MDNNIVIWGTGRMGITAYYYYKDSCNICGYIDNDERKWGKQLNGVNIYAPDVLKNLDATVIIAIKVGAESVAEQLKQEYGIEQYLLFYAGSKEYSFSKQPENDEISEDTCIVYFSGGLGNQMFQYAFYKSLQLMGKRVLAYYKQDVNTINYLVQVFASIDLTICTEKQRINLIKKNVQHNHKTKKFVLYIEENTNEVNEKIADTSIVNVSGGIFRGLFQTHQFADWANNELKNIFIFQGRHEKTLEKIANYISSHNTVGIHIRRGDYLSEINNWAYGDICTAEYYRNAILYFERTIKDCKFVFFSNEIEWVKEHYQRENALYIESDIFEDYHDWYDMYLMSICKHNIIANSTFSWWGAWLNQNEDKIVIAPKKWVNTCDYKDVYPKGWICI